MDEKTSLLICLGASAAANCIPCFEHYHKKSLCSRSNICPNPRSRGTGQQSQKRRPPGLWTAWIVIGSILEERDLVFEFGDVYREYQRRVPMFIPRGFHPLPEVRFSS